MSNIFKLRPTRFSGGFAPVVTDLLVYMEIEAKKCPQHIVLRQSAGQHKLARLHYVPWYRNCLKIMVKSCIFQKVIHQ